MTFINSQFPPNISQGAEGGPMFNTLVITTGSGVEQRIGQWQRPRYRWTVSQSTRTPAYIYALQSFFINMAGRLNSFPFKDWADYRDIDIGNDNAPAGVLLDTITLLNICASDTDTMQMYKNYTVGGITLQRKITKPVNGTITVTETGTGTLVEGTDYSIDYTTGVLTWITTGHTGKVQQWAGQFNVHARFDGDEMKFTQEANTSHSWTSIDIVEIRD